MKKTVLTLAVLLLPLVGGAGDHDTDFRVVRSPQWRFKPQPGRWSIFECAPHIELTEAFLRGTIADKLLASPDRHLNKSRSIDGRFGVGTRGSVVVHSNAESSSESRFQATRSVPPP